MKVSDVIVKFLVEKGITDVFGYPGGMVTHLMESFSKYEGMIQAHVCYHEQAAAFAACSYAQVSGKAGAAYATSGPGATNLITGICNAYFDSVPVIFITGQVNTFEAKGNYNIRQRGFQETDIVEMVKSVTKYAVYVSDAQKILYYLEKAYSIAMSGRRGPVLLDIPMDIQRGEVTFSKLQTYNQRLEIPKKADCGIIIESICNADRPCLVLGAALKAVSKKLVAEFVDHLGIPVVTSMIAVDLLPQDHSLSYGFIGAYGNRAANFIIAKSDFVLVLGSRLDVRQVGGKRDMFAPDAKIIRVDIDRNELDYHIRNDEIDIWANVVEIIKYLGYADVTRCKDYSDWYEICDEIANKLEGIDDKKYNRFVKNISSYVPENSVITTDVGQNQVWVAQSYVVKMGQIMLFSGGHGAMGYSLPAAIGSYYATHKPIICFNGDGGFQMNIQELEFVSRERIPVKIIVFNNYSLGMIRHFQEMYFGGNYTQTICEKGYGTPNLKRLAWAYDINYIGYENPEEVIDEFMRLEGPVLVEIKLNEYTHVYPKLEFGKPNQDQEPLIDRDLYNYLMELGTMKNSRNMLGGRVWHWYNLYPHVLWFVLLCLLSKPSKKEGMQ